MSIERETELDVRDKICDSFPQDDWKSPEQDIGTDKTSATDDVSGENFSRAKPVRVIPNNYDNFIMDLPKK